MFGNFINFSDLKRFVAGVKHGYLRSMISRLTLGKTSRVKAAWRRERLQEAKNWWDLPLVTRRVNKMVSGEPLVNYKEYIAKKYLSNKRDLKALSLGCGRGQNERDWVKFADFKQIDGYDISENAIRCATEIATQQGLGDILKYHVADIANMDFAESSYDVVLGKQSLHHFSSLKAVFQNVEHALKPDGYFIVDEFVGPRRFQWTKKQLELVNETLLLLPEEYRCNLWGDAIKRRQYRPSRLSMILKDPSEAIESDLIMPLLDEIFDIVESKPYGLTVVRLVLADIAHNFVDENSESQDLLQQICDVEDRALAAGDLDSDFIIAVAKRR